MAAQGDLRVSEVILSFRTDMLNSGQGFAQDDQAIHLSAIFADYSVSTAEVYADCFSLYIYLVRWV